MGRPTRLPFGRGERGLTPLTDVQFIERRIVRLVGYLSTVTADVAGVDSRDDLAALPAVAGSDIADALIELDRQAKAPIKLLVDSRGGEMAAGLIVIDTIKLLRSPVWVYVRESQSMATIIAVMGEKGKRYALRNATIHHHAQLPTVSSDGKLEDVVKELRYKGKLDLICNRIMFERTNILEYARNHADGLGQRLANGRKLSDIDFLYYWGQQERYFTAREAVEAGIVDGIVTKQFHREFFGY